MRDRYDHGLGRVGNVPVARRLMILRDLDRSIARPRVIDEESAIRQEAGMKGQTEKSAFTSEGHSRANI